MVRSDWKSILKTEFEKPYWHDLQKFVADERKKHLVYPPPEDVLNAFNLTSFTNLKAVILGQDPYHGPNQAHGLSFSVKEPTPAPPSLLNIFKELKDDLGIDKPKHGNLEQWAKQGVLLLNTTLTVRAHEAGSHQKHGWETFTDEVIKEISEQQNGIVFILWGASARSKKKIFNASNHHIIESPHPSPLSAYRGFWGSKPFSSTNQILIEAGKEPIDWSL